jgi:hypothetical protein
VRRIAISGLVALAAVFGGVAVPATAMAQPTSGVRPPTSARPADDGPITTGMPMISCVMAVDCLGVEGGSSLTSGGPATPTRVARWNGSTWKNIGVALPAGAKSVDLNGVSCRSATSCLVVGDYYKSTSETAPDYPLALTYNGTSLRPTAAVPVPKGVSGVTLDGVSCTSTTHCVAVGTANGDTSLPGTELEVAMIETWNGAKWTLHNVTSSGSSAPQAAGVSCATPTFCVLDGTSITISGETASVGTWLASWNGTKLTTMKSAISVEPTAVSCATTSNCAVTGVDLELASATTTSALTEIWNGTSWRLAKVAWPKGTANSFLLGLSCYAAHSCQAVGMDGPASGTSADALAVSFNGTASKVQALAAPAKGYSDMFSSVSCLPWGSCVAVGETGKTTASSGAGMTGTWSGKAWKLHAGF